jgi:ABC-type Fe3+ transport system permease subunit
MSPSRRALIAAAVLAAVLWPLLAFFLGPADLGDLAAAPYGRSLRLALLSALGVLILGLPAAWALAGSGPAARWLRAGALATLLVPPYLAASAWLGIAWRLNLLTLTERVLAYRPEASPGFREGMDIVLLATVVSCALWPCVAFPAAASLAALGRDCREAAKLARGKWGCFRGVELPVALPAALVGAALAFALALAELGGADLFMINTAPRDVLKGFEASYDFSGAAGRALPLLGMVLLIGGALVLLVSRRRMAELSRARLSPFPAPRWAQVYASLLLAVTLGAVLVGLLLNSGSAAALVRALSEEAGLVARSLLIAVLSAVLATGLGALVLAALPPTRRGWWFALALAALSLPLVLPGALWGIGMLKARAALSPLGPAGTLAARLLDSPLVLVWAGAARAALGCTAVLAWGRRRLNDELLEAARTAGLSLPRRLWLAAGLMRGAVAAALFLGTALALGEIGASVLIGPPGWEVLSVRVFNAMHNGHGDVTAALALVTTGGAVLFGAIAAVLGGRR